MAVMMMMMIMSSDITESEQSHSSLVAVKKWNTFRLKFQRSSENVRVSKKLPPFDAFQQWQKWDEKVVPMENNKFELNFEVHYNPV